LAFSQGINWPLCQIFLVASIGIRFPRFPKLYVAAAADEQRMCA
jgi:hypothetical protein